MVKVIVFDIKIFIVVINPNPNPNPKHIREKGKYKLYKSWGKNKTRPYSLFIIKITIQKL